MLRLKTFSATTGAALVLSALAASPAAAKDHHGGQMHGGWQGQSYGQGPIYYPPMMGAPWPTTVMVPPVNGQQVYPQQAYPQQPYPQAAPRWNEMEGRCRKVYGDRGIGGALLGGLIGGVVGNRVVDGNRTLGTVAGAAVGAIAGTVIDKAEDKDLRRECDDYARSVQQQGAYAPYPGYGAGYGVPGYAPYGYVMVPVMLPQQQPCVETTVVTERWVDQPVRHRYIPRRAPVIRDKRVKEKRVYTG